MEMPEIVCICGSTKFRDVWERERSRLEREGYITVGVESYPHADGEELSPDLKVTLDDLHKRKIDLADWVFILNPGGYVGESTRSEIEYARRVGTPIRFLEEDSVREEVAEFSLMMEDKLRENDHKSVFRTNGGEFGIEWFLDKLDEEVDELREAVHEVHVIEAVVDECVDVANLAMMISRVSSNLEEETPPNPCHGCTTSYHISGTSGCADNCSKIDQWRVQMGWDEEA